MTLLLSLLLTVSGQLAIARECKHDSATGKKILQRVYAAEAYRRMDSPYTDNLNILKYNKGGIASACDAKNWEVKIQLPGKDKFLATIKSKITGQAFTVDESKNLTSQP